MKKKETIASIILLVGFALFILLLSFFVRYVDFDSKKTMLYFIMFLVYMILSFIIGNITDKCKNKFIRYLIYVFISPMTIIVLFFQVSSPFMAVIAQLTFYFIFSTIPFLIVGYILKGFIIKDLSQDVIIFLFLTITAITAASTHTYVLKLINKLSPAVRNQTEKQAKKTIDLTKYILTRNNIRFVIYLSYFVFLTYYSLMSLSGNESLAIFAILQAFLVFLAFDSIVTNSREIKLLPSIILSKMVSILEDASSENRESQENIEEKKNKNKKNSI